VAVSFIGGENRNTRRKPPTYRKSPEILLKVTLNTINLTEPEGLYGHFLKQTLHGQLKTDRHDITEILLKVALNIINLTEPEGLYGYFIKQILH
jgi:hypothetical protein